MNGIYGSIADFFAGTEGVLPRIFSSVLTMSVSASLVILCVLLVRLLLRRAPRVFSYVLWAVVLLRLLCPVTIESPIAIVPGLGETVGTAMQTGISPADDSHTAAQPHTDRQTVTVTAPAAQPSYRPAGDEMLTAAQGTTGGDATQTGMSNISLAWILSVLWLSVGVGIGLYSLVSLLCLRHRLREALRLNQNVYLCDRISTPFVMGIFKPRIYLPAGLGTLERSYIIRHEQHHIRRLDHITKLFAFIALCIHWFNPLVWLAFVLAVRDMEMSCDEAVMRVSGDDIRADYSLSLLALSGGKRVFAPTPLAFGESDTKIRIKNIVRYKKPAAIVVVCAALVVVAACGVLGGTRAVNDEIPQTGDAALADAQDGAENSADADPGVVTPGNAPSGADTSADSLTTEEVIEEAPQLTQEQREEAARTRLIGSIPGLTLIEGADLPYTTDNTQAFEQKDIHNITEAYLLCDFGLMVLTDADALETLSQQYTAAEELPWEPACGFYTPMFLMRADGTVGYVYPAGDDCCTFKAGDRFYECENDLFSFYALFGMDTRIDEHLDDSGRVVERRYFWRLRQESVEVYAYEGELLAEYQFVSDYRSSLSVYSHDEAGRLIDTVVTTRRDGGEQEVKEYVYTYDAADNCTKITIKYDDGRAFDYLYEYDELNRLVSHRVKDGGPATVYEYDEEGNCIKVITAEPGTGEHISWWEYEYDAQGRVVKWQYVDPNGYGADSCYYIQVYEADGSTYRETVQPDGKVVEINYFAPPEPVSGPFFYIE